MNVIGFIFMLGAASMMTLVTLGPFYFLFVELPRQQQLARQAHFIAMRRHYRKQRLLR